MITFNSVLENINKHTVCTAKNLIRTTFILFLFATSLSIALGTLVLESFLNAQGTIFAWLIGVGYIQVFLVLNTIAKSKEVYDAIQIWKKTLFMLSLILLILSVVIAILF